MSPDYNLCIVKPNKSSFSETFITAHINKLSGNKNILYGGAFPVYKDNGTYLISSHWQKLGYLIQKRLFKTQDIEVRNQALASYLKEQKVDVVLAEYGFVGAMIAKACSMANVPLIIHFHGADAHHKKTVEKYFSFFKYAFEYCSAVIVVSKDMMATLIKLGAPKSKLVYIPCGVDIDKFIPVDSLSNSNNFLSIGRFVEKKSPISVVKSFEKVLEALPDSKLWMAGNGPLFPSIEKYIHKNNLKEKIILTGAIDQAQVKSLIGNVKCFVQHSVTAPDGDMEGSPVTIIEASASALPVVSTRHAGIKEAVIDGVTGFLVDEFDTEAMAQKMIEIARSPAKAFEMGRAGRAHIMENYSLEGQILKLDAVIQNALKNKNLR